MRKLYLAITCFCLCSCASRPAVPVWEDAALVAGQRTVIEEQRRTLNDLDRVIGEVQRDIRQAHADLERAIGETNSLREQWAAIDDFVQRVIEAERRLEDLQRTNRGEDAGAG